MFAIRKAVQESSGLNPSELVFAHILHIPLKFVVGRDICHVSNFRFNLGRVKGMV